MLCNELQVHDVPLKAMQVIYKNMIAVYFK